MGDPIDTTRSRRCEVGHIRGVAHIRAGAYHWRALQTNKAVPGWSCRRHRAGGGGSSGDAARFSLVICSVDWSVLTVNIICLSGLYGAVAAILNG